MSCACPEEGYDGPVLAHEASELPAVANGLRAGRPPQNKEAGP